MKKGPLLALAGVFLFAGLVLALESYRFKKIDKNGPAALSPVAATLPGSVSDIAAAIERTFNLWDDLAKTGFSGDYRSKFPYGSKWSYFYLFRREDSVFPHDDAILLDAGVDRFIPRYVAIAPGLRKNDLYLYEPSGDQYWSSEYFYRGIPAKFRCSFFIHLEPEGDSHTRVEVFEYQPTVWAGEKFAFSAHAPLPAMLHDIRFAEPTTSDRTELLAMIQSAYTRQTAPKPAGENRVR